MPTHPTQRAEAGRQAQGHFRHSYTKDRGELVRRLRRIEGQARGVQRLVEGEAYCLEVLQQVEALTAAADEVALMVLEDHIDGCLAHAIESGEGQPYVDEVMTVVRRAMGRRGSRRTVRAASGREEMGGSAAGGNHGTPVDESTRRSPGEQAAEATRRTSSAGRRRAR